MPAKETTPLASSPLASKSVQSPHGQATALQLTVNLITCGLGTGIFTLPWSTAGASVVPAVTIVAVVLALNAWTISILVEAGERHQCFNLGALLGKLPGQMGKAAQLGCNAMLWFSMYLCLVGYIIVIADCVVTSFPPLTAYAQHSRTAVSILASAIVLPLCFLDQRHLSFTSMVAMVATVNIFALVGTQFFHREVDGTRPTACYFGLSTGSIAMVSAMMQTVVIQMCVLPMYSEMKDRSPARFKQVVSVSFAVLFVLFSAFSVIGYLSFGQTVSSNVLLDLPSTAWGHASRLSAAASVVAVYPIILGPMIVPLRSSEALILGNYSPQMFANLATCAVVIAVMFTSFFVHDLGLLNVVNGAMSMGAFVAVAPSLIGLYLLGPTSCQPAWRAKMYALALIGIAFSILGLKVTDNYASQLGAACVYAFVH